MNRHAKTTLTLAAFGLVGALLVAVRGGSGTIGTEARRQGLADEPVATFSIVARDPETGDLGVAVQSKFFAVGAVVPFAEAGVGAVATQAWANTSYGPEGLDLLGAGVGAEAVVDRLTSADERRARRQLGVVDATGRAASFTGEACLPWAGGATGRGYAVQGNILAGPEVVDAMSAAFEASTGDLASRLVAALAAGQAAGGDARGRQSAALLVVREGAGYGGDDRWIDLRVDDHPAPIVELRRLLGIRHAQLAEATAERLLREAAAAPEEARPEILAAALAAAERAVRLDPNDGWGWLTLAAVRLRTAELDGAAAAGIRALEADPWIKTAIVRDLFGPTDVVEELLGIDSFRRAWETIPVR